MHLIRGLKENLLTLTKYVHQHKLVNISMIHAVKHHNVTFGNTLHTICKQQADNITAISAGTCSSTIVWTKADLGKM
jgi:ribosomal protein S11